MEHVFKMTIDPGASHQNEVVATPIEQEGWQEQHQEGQLSVDVADNGNDIVVVSTMAGASVDQIDVFVQSDLLTIRGRRVSPISVVSYVHRECYWGPFSRTVVLPVHVKGDLARAEYTNGVLVVRIPKGDMGRQIPITIIDE